MLFDEALHNKNKVYAFFFWKKKQETKDLSSEFGMF